MILNDEDVLGNDNSVKAASEEVSNSSPLTAISTCLPDSGTVEKPEESEITNESAIFLNILNRMQYIRNFLQMIGDSITVCVAFMIELTLPVSIVNLEKLERENFKSITKNNLFLITVKAFSDSGTDETLISQKLSNCLTTVNTPIKIRSILGDSPGGASKKKATAFIKNNGQVNFFQMGEIQKHCPTKNHK